MFIVHTTQIAIAAKVVRTGRQLIVKLKGQHCLLLERVLLVLKNFELPPIKIHE